MLLNQRTAAKIMDWMRRAKVSMIHHRILKLIYTSAWQEQSSPCDFGDNPLASARNSRSRAWWDTVCFVSTRSQRRKAGYEHAHGGQQKLSWESPFVHVYGAHWRLHRDSHNSEAEWMRGCVKLFTLRGSPPAHPKTATFAKCTGYRELSVCALCLSTGGRRERRLRRRARRRRR